MKYLPCGHLDLGSLRPFQCVCEWNRWWARRRRSYERQDQAVLFR